MKTSRASYYRVFYRIFEGRLLFVLLCLLVSGCFLPEVVPEKGLQCELATKKLRLDISKDGTKAASDAILQMIGNCDQPECLATVSIGLVAVPATSFIVSGSIVVTSNTIHWLEQQGRCENSVTQRAMQHFLKMTQSLGGQVIHSGKELVDWLKQI